MILSPDREQWRWGCNKKSRTSQGRVRLRDRRVWLIRFPTLVLPRSGSKDPSEDPKGHPITRILSLVAPLALEPDGIAAPSMKSTG